jgi:hypothetical protein
MFLTEELAGYLISCKLGHVFSSEHFGMGKISSDCRISQNGEAHGLVEVMTHRNFLYEGILRKILNSSEFERLTLPEGLGVWSCQLELDACFDQESGRKSLALTGQGQ